MRVTVTNQGDKPVPAYLGSQRLATVPPGAVRLVEFYDEPLVIGRKPGLGERLRRYLRPRSLPPVVQVEVRNTGGRSLVLQAWHGGGALLHPGDVRSAAAQDCFEVWIYDEPAG